MLGFIPTNSQVEVVSAEGIDEYGLPGKSAKTKRYECRLSFNTKYEKIAVADGSEIVFTAAIIIPSTEDVQIKVADKVKFIDDLGNLQTKEVKVVQYKRDFGNNVMAIKVVV